MARNVDGGNREIKTEKNDKLALRTIQMIQLALPPAFPAKAGIYV